MSEATPKRRRARRAAPAPTTPDPIEIAMAAEGAGRAPEGVAAEVLRRQSRLIGWEIADRRAAFVLKALAGAAGLVLAVALGAMVWAARQADGVVVEAFLVPPQLAAEGASGEAVARDVLDRLAELDRESRSLVSVRVTDTRAQEVAIEVPQTGVSLGELQRALRRWLGRETYLTGEVAQTPEGLRLTARAGPGRAVTEEGPPGSVRELARGAAERLFAQARPTSYAQVLTWQKRLTEAQVVLRGVLANPRDARERATAENLMGHIAWREDRYTDALRWYERSAASPDTLMAAYAADDVAAMHDFFGHARESAAYRERSLRLMKQVRTPVGRQWAEIEQAYVYAHRSDHRRAVETLRPFVGVKVAGSWTEWSAQYGTWLAALHEASAARRFAGAESVPVEIFAENWPGALAATGGVSTPVLFPLQGAARALALIELGRADEAAQVAQALPMDCMPCVGVRGLIAGRRGDVAGSERLLAESIRMAPDDTYIRVWWGRERLRRGDTDGAIALLEETTRVAPRYADGFSWWGEALLAKGQSKAAEGKFRKAYDLAPRWGRLHLKWGEALAAQGKADEARAKWRAAAGMDLTAAERARVTALLAGARA